MGGKKQQFPFRIPWISGSSLKQTSKTPIQRPPFRPPGIAYSPPITTELHTATASSSGVKKKETQETTVETKMMFAIATSNPIGKDIKQVDANPVTKKNDVSNLVTVNPTTQHPVPMDEKSVSVVTLAGENRGATMHVAGGTHSSQSTRKKELLSINKHQNNQKEEEEEDEAGKAYVNSNIQSMNNSLMLHGSINGRDPGVRVTFPQHPEPEPQVVKGGGLENTSKGEVNTNGRVERLSYPPMVRRRCLRGLFHEPSDSDPDNPNKPRRHGCKFNCGDVTKG